jgi:myo-inositol-1(or 4)-monophosphatase
LIGETVMFFRRKLTIMLPLSDYLEVAVRAARAGAAILLSHRNDPDQLIIDHKGRNDLVSQADREAEVAVMEILREHTPLLGLIGEESGGHKGKLATWYIDPLDGTTNYLHGVAHYAVSIGLVAHAGTPDSMGKPLTVDTPILGVVYDPNREEMFTAMQGVGAWVNGHRLHHSGCQQLEQALVATGIPVRDLSYLDAYLSALKDLVHNCRGVRRYGSAALDLAWVACGRFDAYWEQGIQSWDVAAGTVIAREAGAWVSDPFDAQASWSEHGRVMASTPEIHDKLGSIIRAHLGETFKR